MKKLTELFNRKDFDFCKALKCELGWTTERFDLDTPQEAIEWLNKADNNSIKFVHGLWSDTPTSTDINSRGEIDIEHLS
jgi:hypothetical protein